MLNKVTKYFVVVFLFLFFVSSISTINIQAYQNQDQRSPSKIASSFYAEVSHSNKLIPVIVELQKEPTLEYFQVRKNYSFIVQEPTHYRDSLVSYQNLWLTSLKKEGISFVKSSACTDSINMVSLLIKGTDLKRVEENPQVKKIYDDRYLMKAHRTIMAQSTGTERVWKGTDTIKATGKNIIVGVIDTGMDVDHPEFKGKILGGKNFVNGDSYRTDPVGHGTHVGGIVGGIGDGSHGKGMASDVKFYTYKALGNQGGTSSGIMNAMDQAVKDKCQIINMSLGHVSGDGSKDGNPYYSIVKRVVAANIIVVASSGNSGARGKNVPWPAGTPGIVEDSFCVAASNDRKARVTYSSDDRVIQAFSSSDIPLFLENIQGTNLIDGGFGSESDFDKVEVAGRIVVIKRGPIQKPISFSEKMERAKRAYAKAVIFVDYQNQSEVLPSVQVNGSLPFIFVTYKDGEYLLSDTTHSVVKIDGLSMADFSSMGITPDGAFKPEITAPGVEIMSSVPRKAYAAASGTSMSAPSISGQLALIREVHPDWNVDQLKSAMMNTAYIMVNSISQKPVTFMLQGAGQSRIEKAIQTNMFIKPRAFVVENSEEKKIKFAISNATKVDQSAKISVEYFIDASEKSPIEMSFDKEEISLAPGGSSTFLVDIKVDKDNFVRPKIEGVVWVGELHIPFIILRESAITDNNRALKNPISDIFCSTQQVDYNQADKPLRVNFSFNTGTEQKFEGETSYSNYGSVKVFLTDPQGLLWDSRAIKEFRNCVIGDYSFDWDGKTAIKEFLPNGQFSLKFECSASDNNEIVSKPIIISNSPQNSIPSLILGSPKFVAADSTFSLDLYIPTLADVSEIEYTLYFDTKKITLERAEKTDNVITWDTPAYKTDNIRIRMTEFIKPANDQKRVKLATFYFTAKGLGALKFTNKIYISISTDKKVRSLGYLPDVQITRKTFLLGDINQDNVVDLNDYFLLTKSYDSVLGDSLFVAEYDINQDLMINNEDLKIIQDEMGKQI